MKYRISVRLSNKTQEKMENSPQKYNTAAKAIGRRKKSVERLTTGIQNASMPTRFFFPRAENMKWTIIINVKMMPATYER